MISSVRLIVFSGGECFLLGKDLDQAVSAANRQKLRTRCVTNAYWATSDLIAEHRMEGLAKAGLDELNISTGDYHQKWIPLDNVARAASAAVGLGVSVVVMVEKRAGRGCSAQSLLSHPKLSAILDDREQAPHLRILESPWIASTPEGTVAQERPFYVNERHRLRLRGCSSVLATLVVSPSEQVAACCGLTHEQIPEMRVGFLREYSLSELAERSKRDFLKLWLMIEGPFRILEWAAAKDPSIQWENKYAHVCDACRAIYADPRVREMILRYHQEKMGDILLAFAMFYRGGGANACSLGNAGRSHLPSSDAATYPTAH